MTDFTRTWVPSIWVDRILMPTPRSSPEGFVLQMLPGRYELYATSASADFEFSEDLVHGQVVEFTAFDQFGEFELTVNDDLSFTQDRPTPAGATRYCIHQRPETMMRTLEALVAVHLTPGIYRIGAYGPEVRKHFRFERIDTRTARFVPCCLTSSPALDELFRCAVEEAEKAQEKFPQPNYVITKFAEEAGEVIKGAVHCAEGREKPEKVVAEIRQAIAMLIRLYLEGDQVHGLPPLVELVKGGNADG